ncbi:MAG: hypothetical protein ACTSQF_15230, partial [Candidatus Heimdallarchaeaceae archaeon]
KNLLVKISDLVAKYFEPFWLSRENFIYKHGLKKRQIQQLIKSNNVKYILNSIEDKLLIEKAVDAISHIEEEDKIEYLILELQNEDKFIQLTAALSLLEVENHKIIEPICRTIAANKSSVNIVLISVLNKFKDKLDEKVILSVLLLSLDAKSYLSLSERDRLLIQKYGKKDYYLDVNFYKKIFAENIRKYETETVDSFNMLKRVLTSEKEEENRSTYIRRNMREYFHNFDIC